MLNDCDRFDKHLMRLGKELRDLWDRLHIRVHLREPIQRGWKRFHVLRPETRRRADHAVLDEIAKVIGTFQFRNSPDFRKRRGRGKRRRFCEIEQPLRVLTAGEWSRRKWPDSWMKYFRREQICLHRAWHDVLVFYRPDLFELKIEVNWVDEVTVSDPAVESRMREIDTWLWNHRAKWRLDHLQNVSNRWQDPRRRRLIDRVMACEVREARQCPWEVDPTMSARRRLLSLSALDTLPL